MMTHTGTYFSSAIRAYTRYPYNHASISLNKKLYPMYSFGRKLVHIPLPAGFITENKNTGLYDCFQNTQCKVYEITVNSGQYSALKKAIANFSKEKEKYRYSLLNVVMIPFGRPLERRYYFVCTQFVAKVLAESKITSFDKPYSLVLPVELEDIPNSRVIYEGLLRDYPH